MKAHQSVPGNAITDLGSRPIGRRTLLKAGAVTAAASALAIGGATTQAQASVPGLTEIWNQRFGDRLWDFRFNTTAMTLFPPSVRVILPDGYFQTGRRYPVLMLLHGGHPDGVNPPTHAVGNYLDWTLHGGIADREIPGKDVIIICPDGGNGGFYVNWKGPQAATVNWEEFHVPQLMNWVDQRFRTIVGWKTKAVAGLSMGGYGAMTYAARNPRVFAAASSYSGVLDTFDANQIAVMTAAPLADYQAAGSIFQDDTAMMQDWNPRFRAEGLRGLRLFMSFGDGGDPLRDFPSWVQETTSGRTSTALRGDLDRLGIRYGYRFLPGRTHEWGNWRENFHNDLPGIVAALPHQ